MRRFKLSTAALTAVIAVVVCVSSGASAASLPIHFFDSFNGTSLNTATWYMPTPSPGTSVSVHDGSLWLAASSTAAPAFNTGIGLTAGCQVVGDFDAQMEFTLSTWPAGDNVTLAINAPPLGNTFVDSVTGGDVWGLFVPLTTGFGYTLIPASVRTGALRLVRRGDETSGYFRAGPSGVWQRISEFPGSSAPTFLGMSIWNSSGPFGGQAVSVAVHSFKLEAAGLLGVGGNPCSP